MTPFKNQLNVLLLDCYVAWLEDPELSIGVSMDVNAYDIPSHIGAPSGALGSHPSVHSPRYS